MKTKLGCTFFRSCESASLASARLPFSLGTPRPAPFLFSPVTVAAPAQSARHPRPTLFTLTSDPRRRPAANARGRGGGQGVASRRGKHGRAQPTQPPCLAITSATGRYDRFFLSLLPTATSRRQHAWQGSAADGGTRHSSRSWRSSRS
jgi:hypothetical protein